MIVVISIRFWLGFISCLLNVIANLDDSLKVLAVGRVFVGVFVVQPFRKGVFHRNFLMFQDPWGPTCTVSP